MANAKIDQNDKGTWLAYNDATGLPEPVQVDPVFGYLQVFISGKGSGTYTAIPNARIDANENATLLGYNETTGLVEALRCGNNGELLVTLE